MTDPDLDTDTDTDVNTDTDRHTLVRMLQSGMSETTGRGKRRGSGVGSCCTGRSVTAAIAMYTRRAAVWYEQKRQRNREARAHTMDNPDSQPDATRVQTTCRIECNNNETEH